MFEVIKSTIILDGKEEIIYGLRHEDGTVVENVSANKTEAECLVSLFNEQGVASYQLKDILLDIVDTPEGFAIV